jgi:hypothetical protein
MKRGYEYDDDEFILEMKRMGTCELDELSIMY